MLLATAADALLERVRLQFEHTRRQWNEWLCERLMRLGFPELRTLLGEHVVSLSPLHQRVVAIAREALAEPPALLIDDLGKDLDEYDRFLLLDFVRELSAERGVLAALSQVRDARRLPGRMVLMANGEVAETGELQAFLDDPQTESGTEFVNSGLPAEAAQDSRVAIAPIDMAPAASKPPLIVEVPSPGPAAALPEPVPASMGPRGFYWLLPGQLAGMPLPGLVAALSHDLAALRRCGITQLLSLSQHPPDAQTLTNAGLKSMHLGGSNKEVPSPAQLRMLVRALERWIDRGQGVAVHCLSGNSRTGVVLAAYLMHRGADIDQAEALVKAANPAFALNPAQREVLEQLAMAL
jgi:atypical dual specificity phosphatase